MAHRRACHTRGPRAEREGQYKLDLILEVFGMCKGSVIEDKVIGVGLAYEVDNQSKDPALNGQWSMVNGMLSGRA